MKFVYLTLICVAVSTTGCTSKPSDTASSGKSDAPSFSLAWSEYPSWSAFYVAHAQGLINGDAGAMGPLEEKWGVDLVLKEADYDSCLLFFGSNECDAVCITNMDILSPSLSRDSVVILPTSTSVGADACIVTGIETIDDLKGKSTYGLEMSVSQYCFERNLELLGKTIDDFPFKNMDPAVAAQAMQQGQAGIESIMVWNPFLMTTLRTREDAKVLFDSSTIPEEIIDMVVIGKDSLGKPGGENFACLVADCFYEVCKLLEDPQTQEESLVQLGEKFSNLEAEDMKIVVQQTQFYKTPEDALSLLNKEKFQREIMPMVVEFCQTHGIVDTKPTVGYDDDSAQLSFHTKFIEKIKTKQ